MYNKGNSNSSLTTSPNNNNNGTSNTATSTNSNSAGTTTDRIEWSRATILDFIEDYRRQRVLWDPNTKGYHIKQTKYEALKALGHKYGAEIRSIRSKIKSLRSSFHREHGKVLNGRRKGLSYQPMWFAYDAIRFILDGETGDSDEAEGQKNDSTNRETTLTEPNNNSSSGWCAADHNNIDEELSEERKVSSRDIEHFNNHFLALGLQARHPMAMMAAVEAATAASVAHERRQELEYGLKQQQTDSVAQLKMLELSANSGSPSSSSNINLTSTSATLNPILKPFNSPKPSLRLTCHDNDPITTTTSNSPPPPSLKTTCSAESFNDLHGSRSLDGNSAISIVAATAIPSLSITAVLKPPPSLKTTCSAESFNDLHGSRSLDGNSAISIVAATAIPSLSITAVARTSDFDGSEYCNISADDVKTEIFESDSNELAMLENARTSTPVPLNYHKNATDLTMNRNNINNSNSTINGGSAASGTASSRKRKAQMHSNVNHNEDAPSPSKSHKKQQQHSNATNSRHCDYLNNNNSNNNSNINNINNTVDDDDGSAYATSLSHLQTTLANGNNPSSSNNGRTTNNNNNNSNNNNNNTPIDEYGVFGEYVAITIRKLKASKAKIVVKHLINNLLYEAEMGKYDQGISSCKEPPELYKM